MKKYIVYLTTNTINSHIYVGVHGTENPDKFDGYLGNSINRFKSSTIKHPKEPFHYAVKKYGFDAFRRSTIKVFDTLEEALDLEAEIVNEEFIKRKDTYNVALGGGLPPIHNKIIYQYDLDGNFIREWQSLSEAASAYNTNEPAICRAVAFKRTAANYLWSDVKMDKLDLTLFNVYSPKIPIYIYSPTGEFYKQYSSMSECVKELDTCLYHIQRAIKLGITVKGYYISDQLFSIYLKPKLNRLTGLVHQYTLDGKYIKSFNSIKEVEKEFKLTMSGINSSIKLEQLYKGFLWRRGELIKEIPSHTPSKCKARKIGQYTMDGNFVKTFNTVRECKKVFPNVSKVLNGTAKHCHNFIFKYVE